MLRCRLHTYLVAILLLLSACGGASAGEEPASVTSQRATAQAAPLGPADVAFLQGMVPHHLQAVEMAELVPDHTRRPELIELSQTIVSTQSAEIDQMTALLEAVGEDTGMAGMTHGGDTEQMPGMMDEAAMADLGELRDEEFDLAFLAGMTQHHEGAIEMAQAVLSEGENPEVAELATAIIEAQQSEIEQMTQWQEAWT